MSIQPFTPAEMALAAPSDLPLGVRNIVAWAGALNAAASLIDHLIDTPFIPVSFWPLPNGVTIKDFPNPMIKHPRETPEEHALRRHGASAAASAAVLYGGQLGLDPLVALASIYVVRGKPGLYAEAMVALVKSHGHDLHVEELTDQRCVIRGRRKGETEWQRFTFTMDRARKAGYVKQNFKYADDPQSMLYPRCASIACRSIAPDVLKGIASVEEITDEADPDAPAPKTRTVKRTEVTPPAPRPALPAESRPADRQQPAAPAAQPVQQSQHAGPPLPGEEVERPDPKPGTPGISDPQMRKLGTLFSQLGVKGKGEREDRLTIASKVAGRQLGSSRELTLGEAHVLIDTLESIAHLSPADGDFAINELLGRESATMTNTDLGIDHQDDLSDPFVDDAYDEAIDGAEAEAEADRG